MTLYKGKGTLQYSKCYLVLLTDQGIVDFYRSLIPKYKYVKPQMYPAHISVVRHDIPSNPSAWGKYQGRQINFEYSNEIRNGTVYWWLDAFSVDLEEIRIELGLSVKEEYTVPPPKYRKTFHITLGNNKSD